MSDVTLDFRLTATQRTQLANALTVLETLVNSSRYQVIIAVWSQLDADTQALVLTKAPLFARFLALAERMP